MQIGHQQQIVTSSDFSPILDKDNNFLRLEREAFVDLQEVALSEFSFPKVAIELWNYKEKIEQIFSEKLEKSQERSTIEGLMAIKKDIQDVLEGCFELSEDYRPHEISLSLVQGVPCTKLHADFLPLRLICTYFGPGTIFLPRESTRYPCLNEGRPNKRVLIKDRPVFQAKPFEILILKGRKFNKGELKPCAHRSPEVVKGQKRLVLKIDFK